MAKGTILWGSFRRPWISSGSVRSLKRPLDGLAARRSDRPRQHLPRQVLGWINPKSGVAANARNPAVSGSGLIRSVGDPKDCTQMKSPAGIGFRGRSCSKPRSCRVETQCGSESRDRSFASGRKTAQDRHHSRRPQADHDCRRFEQVRPEITEAPAFHVAASVRSLGFCGGPGRNRQ